jgi:type III secretion protein L
VSKKFISLIHGGDTMRIAPNTKIIPAEEFSTLKSADEVLDLVKKDAVQYKQDVVAECEILKEQAKVEGFDEGFKEWIDHIAKLEEEIQKVRGDMEKLVMPVAIEAAKKIVNKEIELSESTIVDIVCGTLKAVSQHKRITVYVHKSDLEFVEENRPRLKQIFENLEVLSIRPRSDIKQGGCVIETEGGIINAQLENRWRILEAAFESLMKKR